MSQLDSSIEDLKDALMDPSYYIAWQTNIAMAFKDEMETYYKTGEIDRDVIHTVANNAAKNFLDMLIGKRQ